MRAARLVVMLLCAGLTSCQPEGGSSSPDDTAPAATSRVFASPPNCVDLTGDPQAETMLAQLPETVDVRATQCPAVQAGETAGSVQLEVTVDCNGLVSAARVVEGIGHGCDELAATALRDGRFRAATTTTGKNARVRIRYVYEYQRPKGAAVPVPEADSPTTPPPTDAPPPPADAPPPPAAPPPSN